MIAWVVNAAVVLIILIVIVAVVLWVRSQEAEDERRWAEEDQANASREGESDD